MRVYPWKEIDNQGDRRILMKLLQSVAVVFRIVGGLLSLGVASVTGLVLVKRFTQCNDSWFKRGAFMSLGGLLVFVILGGPLAWANAHIDTLYSFAPESDKSTISSLIWFLIRSIAFGFFFQGFAVIMASYVYEVTGSRYLKRIQPTWRMKRRAKKNELALINNDKADPTSMAFGVIVDDPIPWRTARYGKICARPFQEMGHGVIVGGNGTGKTVTAISLAYQAAVLEAAAFYIDFKASLRTLESVKKAATKAGRKFYSFDLGTGSTETSWYDPLDWRGTPSEKASMVVNSLHFTEEGSAAYYRGRANDWLILQFEVIQEVGLYSGESSFDFLLHTATPANMTDRIGPLRRGDDRQKDLYKQFVARIKAFDPKDLTALRQNLSLVVNAGGERLRPQSDSPAILMSRAIEEGAVVYFGLSPSTDQVALKTIGSLILRNLGVISGERMRDPNLQNLRPVLTIVDEASRLQDRAVVMDNLLATAREAEIYLWSVTQSFATWPESTVVEMNTNVQTHIAFRVQDLETANELVTTLGEVPILEEMVEDKLRHRAFQGDSKERSGDARTTMKFAPFLIDAPMELTSVDNLHAYMWFTGSWTRATIEEWESKRLKRPDTIRNDAPLVKIVFMDYETDAEPIQGTSFSELVTSADEIVHNMENTTLKRTRRETLTEDNYDNIHLPGYQGETQSWANEDEAWTAFGPAPQRDTNPSGPPPAINGDVVWESEPTPNGSEPPATNSASDDDGLSWADDTEQDDGPPVGHFYKGGSKAQASTPKPVAEAQQVETAEEEFATDDPTQGGNLPSRQDDPNVSVVEDDDGLLWEEPVANEPAPAAPEPEPSDTQEPGDEFATEAPSHSPKEGQGDSAQTNDGPQEEGADEQSDASADTPAEAASAVGEGDVSEGAGYTEELSSGSVPLPVASPSPSSPPVGGASVRSGGSGVDSGRDGSGSVESSESDVVSASQGMNVGEGADGAEGESAQDVGALGEDVAEGKSRPASSNKGSSRKKKNASDDWL